MISPELFFFYPELTIFWTEIRMFRSELSPVVQLDLVFLKEIQYLLEFTWDSDSSFSSGDPVFLSPKFSSGTIFWVLNFGLEVQKSSLSVITFGLETQYSESLVLVLRSRNPVFWILNFRLKVQYSVSFRLEVQMSRLLSTCTRILSDGPIFCDHLLVDD